MHYLPGTQPVVYMYMYMYMYTYMYMYMDMLDVECAVLGTIQQIEHVIMQSYQVRREVHSLATCMIT